ncbi:MAG: DUF4446 family protein [Defluviitaleaceae bacterium]|nr:DUF4446 family protein [Defluviitaleaceae bacterium]
MFDEIVKYMSWAAVALIPLLIAAVIVLLVMLMGLRKRIDRFMGAKSERHNIEAMLLSYIDTATAIDERYEDVQAEIRRLHSSLSFCVSKVGFVRFNPFKEMGGDLCFALALLDGRNNGVVINTLHSREASYTYAKEVVNGKCDRGVSAEEQEAIDRAAGVRAR